jgi:hypothetical protein
MQSPTANGRISGVIVNEDGQIDLGAQACLTVHPSSDRTFIDCRFRVDREGRFTIDHLPFGKYEVFAINEAEGYSTENQSPGQEVSINADRTSTDLAIHMHSKGAVLSGTIIDKVTGIPIPRAWISFSNIDTSDGGSRLANGQFQVSVPANCDLLVHVTARGYKGWVYTDPANPSRPALRLSKGERKELNIQLEPLPNSAASDEQPINQ